MNRINKQINRNGRKEPVWKVLLSRGALHKALVGSVIAAAIFFTGEGYQKDPLDYLIRLVSVGTNVSALYVQLTSYAEKDSKREQPT